MSRTLRWSLAALAALTAALLVVPAATRAPLQAGVELVAVGLVWAHLLPQRDLVARGWGIIATGLALLPLADAAAVAERLAGAGGALLPSTVLGLAGFALFAAGVVVFEQRRVRVGGRPGGIEVTIFGLGGLAPLLVFIVLPKLQQAASPAQTVVVLCFALADLGVLVSIARLLLTDSRSRSMNYLCLSMLTALTGNFLTDVVRVRGVEQVPAAFLVLWTGGFVLYAAGMTQPDLRGLTYGTDADPDRVSPRRQVWVLAVGSLMPGLAATACLVLGEGQRVWVPVVIGLAVTALVATRLVRLLDHIGEQSEQLSRLARSDQLTGLPNRRSWDFNLARAAAAATTQQQPLGVALLDLDHFKVYNDTHGHSAGDRLLRTVAAVWAADLREGEVLARYGGEEFAVLLPGRTLEEALVRVDELRALVPAPQTASAGVARWQPGTEPELAVDEADAALYLAKHEGRDRTVAAWDPVELVSGSR